MWFISLTLICSFMLTYATHFNGGTIRWAPVNPYDNNTSINITITQTYSWTYPLIRCATNVPISSSGRVNTNLTCVVDCWTDGGYSNAPIDILTDCISVNISAKILRSERSKNITLTAGAHFYLSYRGSAWVALSDPPQMNLQWSILTYIDLRKRPDGFINTPPVVSFTSPYFVIVNQTLQINIPVSDINAGDDVRCRWSTYTTGYRRRKRFLQGEIIEHKSRFSSSNTETHNEKSINIRKRKSVSSCSSNCTSICLYGCDCTCSSCVASLCTGATCNISGGCSTTVTLTADLETTTIEESYTLDTADITYTDFTMDSTIWTTTTTTTIDTPGTLKSTSSFPHTQAIDECGDICFPNTLPSNTILSNCTLTFIGQKAGVWYAVAIQVR